MPRYRRWSAVKRIGSKEFAARGEWIAEPFRQHAHHFSRFAPDGHRPADDVAVTSEPQPPGVMTENRNSASSGILVGDVKGSAEQRLDPKRLEKTRRHSRRWRQFHLVAGSDRLASRFIERDARKILWSDCANRGSRPPKRGCAPSPRAAASPRSRRCGLRPGTEAAGARPR